MTRQIAVIGTGGTIASTTSANSDIALPELTPNELLEYLDLPSLDAKAIDLFHEGSNALTHSHLMSVVDNVRRQFDEGVDAVVITQGTATLPETAYLYDLLLGDTPPVVCTGAMRPMSDLTPDGPANLRDSLLFALDSIGVRKGVYVVIDGAVHAPIDVLKHHAATSAGFVSPGVGVLGWVDGGEVRVRRERRVRRQPYPGVERNVELLSAVFDASPILVESLVASEETKGIVVAGFPGRGAVSPDWMPGLSDFAETGRPILFASAALTGRVVAKHGARATARHLQDLGAIMCGDLAPVKARCLLMAILSATDRVDVVAQKVSEELMWS